MAYVSLYRKYRPQTFEDVVGQEHVTTTLRNAIREGRVASGYLFTGTRGTAKTTCARILAKALNCIGRDSTLTAPTPEPCGVCGPCKSIATSSFVDVLEMDAASHGKVDDVRDLVASIKFPPMEGRYKVYIIDEAHQLSRDAMDAFLKTLEEPPDRVVFVLATTELDKLPITIASRCQVYEFKRGSVAQIGSRVAEVLKNEGVKADPAAVTLIARAADGSYRDSLSLLEQVLAFEREHVTAKDVTVVLGTIGDDVLDQVVGLIADADAAGAFALAGTILESGKDVRQFLRSLAERFRDMLFVGVGARPTSVGEVEESPNLRSQAARFAPDALLHALEVLTTAEQETKRSNQHRLLLEMALLRLMRLPSAPVAQAAEGTHLPASLGVLPKREDEEVKTSVLLTPPSPPASGPSGAPVLGAVRSNGVGSSPSPPPMPDPVMVTMSEAVTEAPPVAVPYDIPPPLADDDLDALPPDDGIGIDAPMPGDDDLDSLPLSEEEDDALPSLVIVTSEDREQADDLLRVQQVADTAPVAPPRPAPSDDLPPEMIRLKKAWQEVVNRLSSKPSTAAVIRDAEPVALNGHTVLLQFTSQFNVDKLEGNERGRAVVEDAINRTLQAEPGAYKVKGILKGHALPVRPAQGRAADAKVAQSVAPKPREAAPMPEANGAFVDEVIAVFGGRLLDDET